MTETTARLALPMIASGQAQKEMTHNEALALIDIAVQASVVAVGTATPPAVPEPGGCWIVGEGATGAWTGQAGSVAGWTAGGWRFVRPRNGFAVDVAGTGRRATYFDGTWTVDAGTPPIADPDGGNVIDAQARTAIAHILAALRGRRIVPE